MGPPSLCRGVYSQQNLFTDDKLLMVSRFNNIGHHLCSGSRLRSCPLYLPTLSLLITLAPLVFRTPIGRLRASRLGGAQLNGSKCSASYETVVGSCSGSLYRGGTRATSYVLVFGSSNNECIYKSDLVAKYCGISGKSGTYGKTCKWT